MPRPQAPCGTASAYKRHKRKGEPVDDACRAAILADSRAKSGRSDDEAQSAPVVMLASASRARSRTNSDLKSRLQRNMDLVEAAMEALAASDPAKIGVLSKRHSELVAEMRAIDGVAPVASGSKAVAEEADPFAKFFGSGSAAGRPKAAPRVSS